MCIYAYKSLSRAWRVAVCISKGLLSLAMRKSELKSDTALTHFTTMEARHDRASDANIINRGPNDAIQNEQLDLGFVPD